MAEPNVSTKLCSKCKIEKPAAEFYPDKFKKDGLASRCKSCKKVEGAAWSKANREKEKARLSEWYKNNTALACQRARDYRIANKEAVEANKKIWRAANPDILKKSALKYRQKPAVKAHFRRKARERYHRHREKYLVKNHKRRARIVNAGGTFTDRDIIEIRKMQRDRCAACRAPLKGGGHRDHIIPLSMGGTNERRNIQLLCQPCNISKGARDPIDFMRKRGNLL